MQARHNKKNPEASGYDAKPRKNPQKDPERSWLTAHLEAHGVEHILQHILGSIGKPTTQGKTECFWQTFELYYPRFNDGTEFLEHYNYVRPHRSLNFLTPAEVYYS